MIRVVLADDQSLIRMGLRVMIDREPDMEIVAEAGDGPAALAAIRRTKPDVALVDIRMPGLDGLEVLRRVTADRTLDSTRVVIVTTFETDEYLFTALQAGASGFILKDTEPGELVRAVRAAAEGEALLSPSVTRRLVDRFGHRSGTGAVEAPQLDRLTAREREIAAWVATGRSNDEIARELMLSVATVRTHVGRAMIKLHARDRAQLVVFALRAGLMPGQ
jgi:DNA-binding NarL/FixJ family response regulator